MASPSAWSRVLIGALITFIPLLNILTLGYIYELLDVRRRETRLELPAWERIDVIALQAIRCVLLWLVFFAAPILVSSGIGWVFMTLLPGFLGPMAWVIVAIGYIKAPVLFTAAVYLFQNSGDWKSLQRLPVLMLSLKSRILELIVPVAAFWGPLVLLPPLYGFTLFFGGIILMLYITQVLEQLSANG